MGFINPDGAVVLVGGRQLRCGMAGSDRGETRLQVGAAETGGGGEANQVSRTRSDSRRRRPPVMGLLRHAVDWQTLQPRQLPLGTSNDPRCCNVGPGSRKDVSRCSLASSPPLHSFFLFLQTCCFCSLLRHVFFCSFAAVLFLLPPSPLPPPFCHPCTAAFACLADLGCCAD